jgi:hypothetical protein
VKNIESGRAFEGTWDTYYASFRGQSTTVSILPRELNGRIVMLVTTCLGRSLNLKGSKKMFELQTVCNLYSFDFYFVKPTQPGLQDLLGYG